MSNERINGVLLHVAESVEDDGPGGGAGAVLVHVEVHEPLADVGGVAERGHVSKPHPGTPIVVVYSFPSHNNVFLFFAMKLMHGRWHQATYGRMAMVRAFEGDDLPREEVRATLVE